VSASTQNQALCALLFLYRHVLHQEIGDIGDVIRARKPKRLPVVLTHDEVKSVLMHLIGEKWLMAMMMYGSGLRLMECLRLRVQDVDFSRNEITGRDGKGSEDRRTVLPELIHKPLSDHLQKVKMIHSQDIADGWGRVAGVCNAAQHQSDCQYLYRDLFNRYRTAASFHRRFR
jgi:integrase